MARNSVNFIRIPSVRIAYTDERSDLAILTILENTKFRKNVLLLQNRNSKHRFVKKNRHYALCLPVAKCGPCEGGWYSATKEDLICLSPSLHKERNNTDLHTELLAPYISLLVLYYII